MLLRGLGAVDLSVCDSIWTAPLCCYDWYRNTFPSKCPDYIVALKAEFPEPPAPTSPSVPDIGYQKTGTNVTPEQAQKIYEDLIKQQNEASKNQLQEFFNKLAESLKQKQTGCSWYESKADDGTCHIGSTLFWAALIGGGIVAVASLKGLRRRR